MTVLCGMGLWVHHHHHPTSAVDVAGGAAVIGAIKGSSSAIHTSG